MLVMERIPVKSLKKNKRNLYTLRSGQKVVILYNGEQVHLLQDLCPHMGGPISSGKFCSKTKTLTCPWHGYQFSTEDLGFVHNPNQKIWIEPLEGHRLEQFKTPQYKLRSIECQREGDWITFDPSQIRESFKDDEESVSAVVEEAQGALR